MFMPIWGAPVETFSTLPPRNCAGRHVKEISSRWICLLKLIFFAHSVTLGDIISKTDEICIFWPSVIFCCYGSKKPLATTLMCYNAITKCLNVLGIMAMITYLYVFTTINLTAFASHSNGCYRR